MRYLTSTIWPLVAVLLLTLGTHAYNLNYNVPFNDEAIYIVVGKFGLYQKDWTTYSADSWMAGSQFSYPVMAALSSQFGDVVGARLLNVLFIVLLVEMVYLSTSRLMSGTIADKRIAGLIAAAITGGCAVGYYVSRLATYDMPSFYFMFVSITLLLFVEQSSRVAGKLYFVAALFLIAAFMTKIIVALYIPFIFLLSLGHAWSLGKKQVRLWWWYFAFVLGVFFTAWIIGSVANIQSFSTNQIGAREKGTYAEVFDVYVRETWLVWVFWIVGSIGMLCAKEYRRCLVLTGAALLILAVHLYGRRVPTFDKHTFISVPFLAAVAGLGITKLLLFLRYAKLRTFALGSMLGLISLFWMVSFVLAQRYNSMWPNNQKGLNYLAEHVHLGDRVLAEAGAGVIHATYNVNYPHNVYTFDYLSYGNDSGVEAYRKAVDAQFFDVIQLQRNDESGSTFTQLHDVIQESLPAKYVLVYDEDGFLVYRRAS